MNRREFLKTSAVGSGSLLLPQPANALKPTTSAALIQPVAAVLPTGNQLPDLSAAKWIWYPSGRTLQNTFILLRREVQLRARPRRATGWICADSRYRLEVNGQRVQWGPAPSDPRWAEADPLDLTSQLKAGTNVIGATVLFYGTGDGTWPIGKPGFIFKLETEDEAGNKETIISDKSWLTQVCRAWEPGHYKRWYLRALQEEFDARGYPYGWAGAKFKPGKEWETCTLDQLLRIHAGRWWRATRRAIAAPQHPADEGVFCARRASDGVAFNQLAPFTKGLLRLPEPGRFLRGAFAVHSRGGGGPVEFRPGRGARRGANF